MEAAGPTLVALAVVLRGDAVLLQRRDRPPDEGRWELPGGKVLPGERPEEAALRELREEVGLAGRAPRLAAQHEHRYPGGPWVRLLAYAVDADPAGLAGSPRLRWVPLREAASLEVLEGTRPLLEALAGRGPLRFDLGLIP